MRIAAARLSPEHLVLRLESLLPPEQCAPVSSAPLAFADGSPPPPLVLFDFNLVVGEGKRTLLVALVVASAENLASYDAMKPWSEDNLVGGIIQRIDVDRTDAGLTLVYAFGADIRQLRVSPDKIQIGAYDSPPPPQ
jgi:hypothetical protein